MSWLAFCIYSTHIPLTKKRQSQFLSLLSNYILLHIICCVWFFKPLPPVGAGGGYMFSGHPSVPLSVRPSVRLSVIHVVALCFRDISSICWWIFTKFLSLVHLGTAMNWLDFGVKRSNFKVTAWPNASQIFIFPLYLQYLLIDFRQTFVLVHLGTQMTWLSFLGQKVKVQGHTIAAEAHSTRWYTALDATVECNFF